MPEHTAQQERGQHENESEERSEGRSQQRRPQGRLMVVVQVLALVVALALATYNHALLGNLPTSEEANGEWLVESEGFQSTPPCQEGGVRMHTGFDTNQNGVLDAVETTSTAVICNGLRGLSGPQGQPGTTGSPALTHLVNTTLLDPGHAVCSSGGVNLTHGLDVNANGMLDISELNASRILCNGTVGLDGANGSSGQDGTHGFGALVDKVTAPSYVCSDGFQIRFGIDDGAGTAIAGNGMMEDDEVQQRLSFCFEPLRSERVTDMVAGIGNSFTTGCDAATWMDGPQRLVMAANDGVNGCELHVHSGAANGSDLLVDIHPNGDSLPGRDLGFHTFGQQNLVFFDASNGVDGRQLWVSDATLNGTKALGAVEMQPPVSWHDGLVWMASSGTLLWTNGTELLPLAAHPSWNTTTQTSVSNALASLNQWGSGWLHGANGHLWFSGADVQGDVEPYRLSEDGTLTSWAINDFGSTSLTSWVEDGHDLLASALRGSVKQVLRLVDNGTSVWLTSIAPASGDTHLGEGMGLHVIGSNLVYDAVTTSNEARLWTTNLDNGITLQLSNDLLSPGAQAGVASTATHLLFDCMTSIQGTEWCTTDGTPQGSKVLHDLTPGMMPTDVRGVEAVGDGWLVVSDGQVNGTEQGVILWAVEGESIRPVYDPSPASGTSSQAMTYGRLVVSPTQVFFIAHDGSSGHEWHRWSHGELSDDWIVIAR